MDKEPLFYQGAEEFREGALLQLTGEVQPVKLKMEEISGMDLKVLAYYYDQPALRWWWSVGWCRGGAVCGAVCLR